MRQFLRLIRLLDQYASLFDVSQGEDVKLRWWLNNVTGVSLNSDILAIVVNRMMSRSRFNNQKNPFPLSIYDINDHKQR